MSLALEYVGFAEGATMDYRGNVALLGFAMAFVAVPAFPAQVAPFFVVVAVGEEGVDGLESLVHSTATFRIHVEDPAGQTVFHAEQLQQSQKKQYTNMPGRLQMIAQAPISVSKPGKYTYRLDVIPTGADEPILSAEKSISVVTTEDLGDQATDLAF